MGLGLKSAILTRPAFAILVSEYALSTVSRECGGFAADKTGTNKFGRAREDIDEDILDAIQPAAYSFVTRVENSLKELCSPDMTWFNNLPEYQKLNHLSEWAKNSTINKDVGRLIDEAVTKLKSSLTHFVRGRILWCINRKMFPDDNMQANSHRAAETYLKEYKSDFGSDIYLSMVEREKMLTTFPWKTLRNAPFGTSVHSNLLFDELAIADWDMAQNQKLATLHGVKPVRMDKLFRHQTDVNQQISMAILQYNYNFGNLPQECFRKSQNYPLADIVEMENEKDWVLPATACSSKSPTKVPRFSFAFQAGESDELHHTSESAADLPSSRDFQAYLESRDVDTPEKREAVESSASSTTGLTNFPLRPKNSMDSETMPLLEKQPNPSKPSPGKERPDPFTAMTTPSFIYRLSNIIGASSAFLSTQHTLADPLQQAIDLHNADHLSSGTFQTPHPPFHPPATKTKPKLPIIPLQSTEACIPQDNLIERRSPFFSLQLFFDQVTREVRRTADVMLNRGDELDFTVLTDTLLCLSDEEWKYLPLWAGGLNDGSGGVFAPMVPPAPVGAGASGPGPAFHTGYSMASRDGTEVDFDGTSTIGASFDTSIAVENGFSDHIDRRLVMSENESDFHSEAFSDDTEDYVGHQWNGRNTSVNEDYSNAYVGKGKGKAIENPIPKSSDEPERSVTPKPEDDWDVSDEEEAFDFGDEEMEDVNEYETVTF
jgi:hypothetical protein